VWVLRQVELAIEEIHVMSRADPPPFDVESAARSAETIEEVKSPCQRLRAMPGLLYWKLRVSCKVNSAASVGYIGQG
jgi:hypothetical protein